MIESLVQSSPGRSSSSSDGLSLCFRFGTPPPPRPVWGGPRSLTTTFRGGGFPGKQRSSRGMRGDPRSIIEYRDLDAPDDLDFF
ncbi:serrate RNA effector molecule homolog [Cyprinodon tularosa]|uniref:serrate RNA effector molecule homolog n=1 Tax=Cyprinodon tularosa TaxID=77115 RepID=UPI0018E2424E|nr:serrate RNA effector molecule homolog [Cyprinodon tularosa]